MRFKLNSVSTTAEGIILDVTALDALPPDTGPDPDDTGEGHGLQRDLYASQRPIFAKMVAEKHPWAKKVIGSSFVELEWWLTQSDRSFALLYDAHFPASTDYPVNAETIGHSRFTNICIVYQDFKRLGKLTPEQDAHCIRWMKAMAEWASSGNVRPRDSDLAVPAWCGCALTDTLLGTDYVSRPHAGGWAYDPARGDFDTLRNAVRTCVARLSRGGIWCESQMYNPMTSTEVIYAHDALLALRGADVLPEVIPYREAGRIAAPMAWTPDFKQVWSWGDTQDPGNPRALWAVGELAAFGRNDLIPQIMAALGPSESMPWAGWRYINPYATEAVASPFSVFAEGQGVGFAKNERSLFAVRFAPNPWEVDHNHPFVEGDFSLYHDGRWAVHAPKWYDAVEGLGNVMLFSGLEGFDQQHETKTFGDGATWFAVTGGDYGHLAGFDLPEVLKSRRRSIVWLTNPLTIIVRDTFDVLDAHKEASQYPSYHNFPIAVARQAGANQVVVPIADSGWNQDPYWIVFDGKTVPVTHAPIGNETLLTVNGPMPRVGQTVQVRGGRQFAQIMAEPSIAKRQLYVPPGAVLTPDGCGYAVGDLKVSVTHYGGGKLGFEQTPKWLAAQAAAYPQRVVVTSDKEGPHDWFMVIRVGHTEPISVSGDAVKVGRYQVRFLSDEPTAEIRTTVEVTQ